MVRVRQTGRAGSRTTSIAAVCLPSSYKNSGIIKAIYIKIMNNSFTKTQTIVIVIIAGAIAWIGAVFQLRGSFDASSGALNIPGNTSAGLPQTVGGVSSTAPAAVPAALVRGSLVEIKDTELSLKMDAAQGTFAEGTLRRATLTAKT